MKRLLFLIGIAPAILVGCKTNNQGNTKPTIVVSIQPQKYFVDRIVDTLLRVEVMVPPGSSPEIYEPTASQLKSLSSATAYFSLGLLEFEMSMLKNIQEQNPSLLVVNHSLQLDLLEGHCDGHHHNGHEHRHGQGFDPHVWSSPTEVGKMVRTIADVLSKQFPNYSSTFELNAQSFLSDIDSLDRYIRSEFAETTSKKIFIFHPALTYYARDYGLSQISLEEEGKSPSMKHFKSVLQTAKTQGANTIFIQKEFDANIAKTAATDIGGRVEVIDPLDKNWLNNMYHITNLLKSALNGE